jgi:hypothetical protein
MTARGKPGVSNWLYIDDELLDVVVTLLAEPSGATEVDTAVVD